MPQISNKTKDKISEQVLSYLFSTAPEARFTSDIASNLARDEEFIKALLQDLHQKKLVIQVNQNSDGKEYTRRQRWRLSNQAYDAYKRIQQ